ncbi:MAG: Primosomal replication protein n [Rhodocyclaceae bacterium]|nr:primosomal replication protein N [Zoogloeaceae bacterium]MBV6408758.1 Primosomal replication protein n [Rhodocyclaceae bacterium]MCK6385449.1 primosomal replication protein N [Rhodocyclaceae bacterium]CAG0932676.1 Primosomal replication protein N [Rhodocyclaceae bacterium]
MTAPQNRLAITGSIIELEQLRHTPAGVPVLNFRIGHISEQIEAGQARKAECELPVVALGELARLMQGARPGDEVRLTGFLAAKSLKSKQPVLHVERIEFTEGMNHGI